MLSILRKKTMNLRCLFGHDSTSEIVDQPNKKVIKLRMYCPNCNKEHGVLTWPNMRYGDPCYCTETFFPCKYCFYGLGEDQGCTVPPEGWYCTREPGHDGPCAALPSY
jgi:hypothetical protein